MTFVLGALPFSTDADARENGAFYSIILMLSTTFQFAPMASAENRYTRYQDEITRIFQIVKIENKLHLCCCGGVGVGVQHSGTWGWYFLQQHHSTTAPQQREQSG